MLSCPQSSSVISFSEFDSIFSALKMGLSWLSYEEKQCRCVAILMQLELDSCSSSLPIISVHWFLLSSVLQEAADAAKSAMVSVIGLDSEKVQLLCDAANEEVDEENKVQIANYLCPVR